LLRQPEPPPPPIRELGDEQAEMPRSSVVRPQYIGPPTPVVRRFSIEKRAAANRWSPGRWRNLWLAITAFLVPALAAAGVLKGPGIIASFHSTSNFNGARETAALGALPNRIGSASFGESGSTRTPIPAQGGRQSGDCGQQVMAG
jgi:hypothetical protein